MVREKPEFIVIEEPDEAESKEYYHSFMSLERSHYSPLVRFFFFLGSFLIVCFSFLLLILSVFYLVLNAATFFQVASFKQQLIRIWGRYKTVLVFSLGLFIATLSPPFGFSIILVYFMLQGQRLENTMMSRFMRMRPPWHQ